jgi:hypothetical protein
VIGIAASVCELSKVFTRFNFILDQRYVGCDFAFPRLQLITNSRLQLIQMIECVDDEANYAYCQELKCVAKAWR